MKTTSTFLLTLGATLTVSSSFAQAPATATATPVPQGGSDVGVSSRDGITVSGADVLVTRNGVTERLTKELSLPNGLRVQPDGSVMTSDGGKLTLRPTQVLTFEGKFSNAPIVESVAPPQQPALVPAPMVPVTKSTTTTTTTTGAAATAVAPATQAAVPPPQMAVPSTAAPATNTTAPSTAATTSTPSSPEEAARMEAMRMEAARMEAARMDAARRNNSGDRGAIRAGEGVQK